MRGTRFLGVEVKLRVHESKITGLMKELKLVRVGFSIEFLGVDDNIEDLTSRIDKMDLCFDELK